MHDELNQQISLFIDNELAHADAMKLLQQINQQPETDKTLRRFELISEVMKNEKVVISDADFVKRVSQEIKQEPFHLCAKRHRFNQSLYTTALAIAATVAVVAVLVTKEVQTPAENAQHGFVVADSQTVDVPEPEYQDRLQPVDSRFDDYLQAHRGNLYMAEPAVHPYARLAGYGQE